MNYFMSAAGEFHPESHKSYSEADYLYSESRKFDPESWA